MNEFGARIKERRIALGFTLRDVEAITEGEISNAYLSQLEGGKIKNPSVHVVFALCLAYAIPMENAMQWLGTITKAVPPEICGECGRALPLKFAIDASREILKSQEAARG